MDTLKEIYSHLELLGYQLATYDENNSECYVATHPSLNSLILIKLLPHFITVAIRIDCNKPMSIDMLKYINEVNHSLIISSASCEASSDNETMILLHSIYTGVYSKEVFGQFYVLLEQDLRKFIALDNFEQIFVN